MMPTHLSMSGRVGERKSEIQRHPPPLLRVIISSRGPHTNDDIYLPSKTPPPAAIRLGVRASTGEFQGEANIKLKEAILREATELPAQ